jgi:hypothetical protein
VKNQELKIRAKKVLRALKVTKVIKVKTVPKKAHKVDRR